jgi:hypothetical protein
LLRQAVPACAGDDDRIRFVLPEHFEGLSLRVVIDARHSNQGGLASPGRCDHRFDEVLPLPNLDDLPYSGGKVRDRPWISQGE